MSLEDRAEALASDLGVDKQEVTDSLKKLVSYDVPLDEAVQSVRRQYGGDGGSGTPTAKDVADVAVDDGSVAVTGVVLTAGTRSIRYQGDDLVIREGRVADGSGTIDYTAWDDFGLEPGDVVTIGNAGVREWEGQPELNLGDGTSVSPADEEIEVPHEIGGERSLVDLRPGDRGVTVEVEVVDLERRTIDGRDGETDILSGVVADETARLPVTDWAPHDDIAEGATLRIENAYVDEFRGAPAINVTEFSTAEPLDRAVEVKADATEMAIGDAVEAGGVYDVAVEATVLEIRDGSGLIQRCPECNRVVQNDQCRNHGEVDPEDDLRIKAILDDGTGTVTAIFGHDLTAGIYGGDLDDALDAARDAMDRGVVADAIEETMTGRPYHVRGRLSVDEYGANLTVTEHAVAGDDPAAAATGLIARVGGDPA